MKRLIIRLSVVSVVLILGVTAILQSQQGSDNSEVSAESKTGPTNPAESSTPEDESLGQKESKTEDTLFSANAVASRFTGAKIPVSTTPSPEATIEQTIVRANEDKDPLLETEGELAPSRLSRYSDPVTGSSDIETSTGPVVISNLNAPRDLGDSDQPTVTTPVAPLSSLRSEDAVEGESPTGNNQPLATNGIQTGPDRTGGSSVYSSGSSGTESQPDTDLGYTRPSTLDPQLSPISSLQQPLDQRSSVGGQTESDGRRRFSNDLGSSRASLSVEPVLSQQRSSLAGSATPGSRQLEGAQAPSLQLEKAAPDEIQINKPAIFEIKVQNVGKATAHDVVVTDQVPRGTRLIGASPGVSEFSDGAMYWQLGKMAPGDEKIITLELMPEEEGEIGSIAQVSFAAQASVRTFCTRPMLTIEHSAPPKVLIGESVTLSIVLSNPGTGAASGIILEENVPDGLTHEAGNELEYEIGILQPGETRKLELTLKADKAGFIQNVIGVHGDANLKATDSVAIEVVSPQLEVALKGPKKRYLNRQATYTVSVSNPGTAAAQNIELVAYLPKGLKFIESNNQGQYDPQNHAVYWSLDELSPAKNGSVQLTTLPIETGSQKLRVEGRANLGLSTEFEQTVEVDGLAEIFFSVSDIADPIEVGSETMYEVKISNKGSKIDTNIRLAAELPPGMKPINGDGPTAAAVEGQVVYFEPLARLAPGDEVTYKIQAQGLSAGDQRIRIQVVSDEAPTPVAKEENTRVYADQ